MTGSSSQYYLLVFSCVAIAACDDVPAEVGSLSSRQQHIINGAPAAAGAFPSTGALVALPPLGELCTGILIAPDMVLTAAHCLDHPSDTRYLWTFESDVRHRPAAQSCLNVTARALHPDYDARVSEYDVGLVFLEQPSLDVPPARLLHPSHAALVTAGQAVDIVGYGSRNGKHGNSYLKYFGKSVIGEVSPYELQLSSSLPVARKSFGDSGSPTFINTAAGPLLIGVHSRYLDITMLSGVETRVDAVYTWIVDAARQACNRGLRSVCYEVTSSIE